MGEKTGPGRPPTLGGEGVRVKVTIYMHPAEKENIKGFARERGMPVAEFIRRAVRYYLESES